MFDDIEDYILTAAGFVYVDDEPRPVPICETVERELDRQDRIDDLVFDEIDKVDNKLKSDELQFKLANNLHCSNV